MIAGKKINTNLFCFALDFSYLCMLLRKTSRTNENNENKNTDG